MSSFLQFVLDNQLPIAKDVEKPWFKKVWMPLTMRQISVKPRPQLGTGAIISITSDILNFLGYEGAPRKQQEKFRELLERAEIPFKRITCNNPDADESIKEDGLKLTEFSRHQKRWITIAKDV